MHCLVGFALLLGAALLTARLVGPAIRQLKAEDTPLPAWCEWFFPVRGRWLWYLLLLPFLVAIFLLILWLAALLVTTAF